MLRFNGLCTAFVTGCVFWAAFSGVAMAQSTDQLARGVGATNANHLGQNTLTQDQIGHLSDYIDRSKQLAKDAKARGKTVEQLLADYRAKATELTKLMPLNCEVSEAMLAAEGRDTIEGRLAETHTYEAACTNGMGYFLVDVEGGKPYGFSCLAAEATRKADSAAKRPVGTVCRLSANESPETLATSVLSHAGVNCTVTGLNWLGQNAKNHIEYNEAACADGKGYVLASALPGQTFAPQAMSCHDAATRGIICKLTESGPVITKQSFIDTLAKQGVACTTTVDKLHLIGRENGRKRYVVEFSCPEQPRGLVAFIPFADSKAPFESMDCKAAAKKQAICKLNTP